MTVTYTGALIKKSLTVSASGNVCWGADSIDRSGWLELGHLDDGCPARSQWSTASDHVLEINTRRVSHKMVSWFLLIDRDRVLATRGSRSTRSCMQFVLKLLSASVISCYLTRHTFLLHCTDSAVNVHAFKPDGATQGKSRGAINNVCACVVFRDHMKEVATDTAVSYNTNQTVSCSVISLPSYLLDTTQLSAMSLVGLYCSIGSSPPLCWGTT